MAWIPNDAGILVRKAGADVGTRPAINFIAGSNVTITTTDDGANDEVDVTIAASGGGGGGGKSYVTEPGMRPPDSPDAGDVEFQSQANGTNPATSLFSWGNQGSATAQIDQGFCVMSSPSAGGLRALLKATPGAGNFEVDTMLGSFSYQDTHSQGLVLLWGTPGTPTAIETAGLYRNSTNTERGRIIWTQHNTSYTPTADRGGIWAHLALDRKIWLRVEWDGTNLVYKASPLGVAGTYRTIYTATLGRGRPDYVGIGLNSNGASQGAIAAFSFLRFNWTPDFDPTTDD